jgi:two-component system, NtrC family, sensor histidine kinase PilS
MTTDPQLLKTELSGRLQALMLMRVLLVSILLGAALVIQIRETQTYYGLFETSHFLLVATIYLLTIIYFLFFKYSTRILWLTYLQLLLDTLLVTAIIYSTGGADSIFSFLYMLVIISGSTLLYRKGGILVASASSILYGLLLDLQYYGVIHPPETRGFNFSDQGSHTLYLLLVNMVTFYLIAFVSSYLSERIRKGDAALKASQRDVSKLELLNDRIIKSMGSGLIALDERDRVVLFNPAAEKIFDLEGATLLGCEAKETLPTLYRAFLGNDSVSKKAKEVPSFFDFPFFKRDGSQAYLRLAISPLRLPSGEEKGRILFFQDMTENKKIEEEMKKVEGLALIGELAAAIAHEIRNPMASISGSIQMLKDGLSKEDVNNRLMDIILREINRLNHLIKEFLLFARPKKAAFRSFDLREVIQESLELFQNSQHGGGRAKVRTELPPGIQVDSDPELIKQVLWNLLLNGTEAMGKGGSLHISMGLIEPPLRNERAVEISIRDTGPGFDPEALRQIFTPFFTTKEGGSGLGLAIVKRIVEGLRGEVFGMNHPQGGAEVKVILPLNPSPHDRSFSVKHVRNPLAKPVLSDLDTPDTPHPGIAF